MPLTENSFLKVPWETAITLYNNEIVPRVTKKNKRLTISAAIAMALVYFIRDKVFKPPRNIRHISYLSYLGSSISALLSQSIWDRAYAAHIPEIDRVDGNGLFVEQGRFGWMLHVSNPEAAKQVFMRHELFPKIQTKDFKETLPGRFIGGNNMLMASGPAWKAQRMIANPAFHQSMPVKLFGRLTQDLFNAMETMEETVNVTELMERWTLEVIGKAGFDFDFNAIKDANSEWVIRYYSLSQGFRNPFFAFFPIFDTTFLWMFPKRVKLHKEMTTFMKMLDNVISKKTESLKNGFRNHSVEETERDLLDLMITSAEKESDPISDAALKSNLCVFFMAGHDTTAGALSFAIHYLAQNQDIQQRVREEAIDILGDEPEDVLPTIEDTRRMTYISQIIKETLRINGSVTKAILRVAAEDTELSGTFIPKGTKLVVNIFNIQHSEKVWKNADKFDPDRFSENGEASHAESMAWTPFGNGARQCIGMNFSLNEQRVLLSMLLRKFTWETPANSIHRNGVKASGLSVIGPHNLDITFHKRY